MAIIGAVILHASGGTVYLISTNQVSGQTGPLYRFEPSSAVAGTWVMSWAEYNPSNFVGTGYTSAWDPVRNTWTTPYNHTSSGSFSTDNYLAATPSGGYDIVGLDQSTETLYFSTSSDGQNWSAPAEPLGYNTYPVDYPSLAVSSGGIIGIGFNFTNGVSALGYRTIFSCDGGQHWTNVSSYPVTSSENQIWGRIVAVGNTFYVLLPDFTYAPTVQLDVFQFSASGCPSGGDHWSLSQVPSYYTEPNLWSPTQYCDTTPGSQNYNDCGVVHYATNIDVEATSAGWAVVYPVARSDNASINNLNFCTQAGGCATVSYSTDLFAQGITTSANGDIWLSMLTYSGAPNRNLPLQRVAIYCTSPGNCPANGSPGPTIDPTWWAFLPYYSQNNCSRCKGVYSCFSAGEYTRTAMNTFTGATVPFVIGDASYATDLKQVFIEDPATGLPPIPGLSVGPALPFGSDITYKGILSSAEVARRKPSNGISAVRPQ